MPQAAARSLCGRGPHPLCTGAAGVLRHETGRQEKAAVVGVWALCAGLRAGVEAVLLSRAFRRRWAAYKAVAVQDSHDAVILAIQNIQFQKKNASGGPVWGPLGVFDFSTRIKNRRGNPGGSAKKPRSAGLFQRPDTAAIFACPRV